MMNSSGFEGIHATEEWLRLDSDWCFGRDLYTDFPPNIFVSWENCAITLLRI